MDLLQVKLPPKLIDLPFYTQRYVVLPGGRDSAKSHSIARVIVSKGYQESKLILCTRQIQNTIKDSVYLLLKNIIIEMGLEKAFKFLDNEIKCLTNDTRFIFKGLKHNTEEIKSLEGVDICWVSEAKTVSHDSWRILIPTIRKENSQFYIDYNPDQVDDPVHDMFIVHERADSIVIPMKYSDNPFLSETSKKEIDYMKSNNPEDYNWIYGGNVRNTTQSRILNNIVIHDFEIDVSRQPLFGGDWGYNDPCTLSQSYVYDNELFICREFYETNLDPDMIKDRYSKVEWIRGRNVIADSARKELIALMNTTGMFTFTSAKKSIGQPIKEGAFKFAMAMYFKQFRKIHIHETNCPNACKEFPRWSFETDKNDKILDMVRDGDDHVIDSVIYSHETPARIWYRTNFKR